MDKNYFKQIMGEERYFRLLMEPGVSGFGIHDGEFVVYLTDRDAEQRIGDELRSLLGDAIKLSFVYSGSFNALSDV